MMIVLVWVFAWRKPEKKTTQGSLAFAFFLRSVFKNIKALRKNQNKSERKDLLGFVKQTPVFFTNTIVFEQIKPRGVSVGRLRKDRIDLACERWPTNNDDFVVRNFDPLALRWFTLEPVAWHDCCWCWVIKILKK